MPHIRPTHYALLTLLAASYTNLHPMQGEALGCRTQEYADRHDPPKHYQPHVAAMLGGALGDALGRVTEFKGLGQILNTYPNGCCSFEDFANRDWWNLPETFTDKRIAPYTDDTRMALVVAKGLLSSIHRGKSCDETMQEIAQLLIKDMNNDAFGWAAPYRAPGCACLNGISTIESRLQERRPQRNWWLGGDANAGGCGSVMRAHPFGLLFDEDKAAAWALEHSKITHGHAMALAASAAMAWGTARARLTNPYETEDGHEPSRQTAHELVDTIINGMALAATPYDTETAEKIKDAHQIAHKVRELLTPFDFNIHMALQDQEFRAFHKEVFERYPGWRADDAIAATVYAWALFPTNIRSAIYVGVHTPGDSDSIASMTGALAGALGGNIENLPTALLAQLEGSEELQRIGRKMGKLAS